MASNAQYLAANLNNHYLFKQQQFNSILKYLVSQESITPGASTALIEDIQRQQSALKERRLALSRLRQSGLLADKELIVSQLLPRALRMLPLPRHNLTKFLKMSLGTNSHRDNPST